MYDTHWKGKKLVYTSYTHDPESMEETQRICGNRNDLSLMGTKEAAFKGAYALVICAEWQTSKRQTLM